MIRRPWTKEVITDKWIEIRIPYTFSDQKSKIRYETIAEDLNRLLKDHYMWKDFEAEVNTSKEEQCIFCGHKYEEMYEDDDYSKERPLCQWCGKGELEMMLKKLEESKNING